LSENLVITVAFSNNDTEFKNISDDVDAAVGDDLDCSPLPGSAETQYSVTANYAVPLKTVKTPD